MDQQQGQFGQEQGQDQAQGQFGQTQAGQNQGQQAWQSQQTAQTGQGQTRHASQTGQNWTASTGGDWPGTPEGQDGAVQAGQASQAGQYSQATQSGQGGGVQVVAVRKNGDGDIVELKLSSGQVVDYKTAQSMSKQGILEHTNVFKGRDGEEHLRSDADGDPSNNLDNLPTF